VLFLGAGRADLNQDKGLDDLLTVLPDLWRAHPQGRWVLAGLSEPQATLKSLMASGVDPEGPLPRLRCLGLVDAEAKEVLLKESSIFVLPSYFENMPNTLLEAMAAGLGVVATNVGAIPELLGVEGGAVIAPGDLQALSSSLGRLLASPPLVDAQGQRNQEMVRRHYTLEAVEADLEGLYREIDTGGRSSRGNVRATIQSASRPDASPTAVSNGQPVARR
jgi:glycosyltransferase involved in cell wall biosynthesis